MGCCSGLNSVLVRTAMIVLAAVGASTIHRTFWGKPISFSLTAPSETSGGATSTGGQGTPSKQPANASPSTNPDKSTPRVDPPIKPDGQPQTPGPSNAIPAQPDESGDYIDTAAVKARMAAGTSLFVDARNADEFVAGHLRGAINLAVGDFAGDKMMATDQKINMMLDRYREVIVYCGGGACDASMLVAKELQARGFSKLKVYKDGFTGWQKEGLEVSTEPEMPPLPMPPGGGGQ